MDDDSADERRLATAVLVRSHNPTAATICRLAEWHASLSAANVPLHLSMDVTHGRAAADEVKLALSGVRMHTYTEAELMHRYPRLEAVRERMAGEASWKGLAELAEGQTCEEVTAALKGGWRKWAGARSSIAWGMHTEAIRAWYQHLKAQHDEQALAWPPFEFVWVLEDDVGFTAPLADLVRAYTRSGYVDRAADLITDAPTRSTPVHGVRCEPRQSGTAHEGTREAEGARVVWEGWCWHDTCSDAYALLVPSEQRWKTKEHAQRFSRRLLDELADRCDAGCSAWSEQAAVSLCLRGHDRGFRCAPLQKMSLPPDPSRQYNHDGRVTKEEYEELCRQPETRGCLLHALKW